MKAPAARPALQAMRARARVLLALVLPALLVRALIPVGFMPSAGSGGPAMQLCPGTAAMAGGHHHAGTGAPEGAAHTLCVFAASAAPAVAPVVPAILLRSVNIRRVEQTQASSIRSPSILRTQSARAPPVLG